MAALGTVSICVPTYNRPALLNAALRSCLTQTRRPECILVGDDSTNDESERLIADLARKTAVGIDFRRNQARLGQNENINSLFDRATTSHLILLHDDDELLPNAVSDLLGCWSKYPTLTAAFGKQYLMSHDGDLDLNGSERYNAAFYRTPDRAGLQTNDWEVGLRQQFPNDGYMILTQVAQSVRWRPEKGVGAGGDFDFGLRVCLSHRGFFFLDKYTMKYRLTESDSISSSASDDAALRSYLVLGGLKLPSAEGEKIKSERMSDMARGAIIQAIRRHQIKLAWRIYWSRDHSWRRRLSLGGARRLVFMLFGVFMRKPFGHRVCQ